ncbi:hypothetical protein [Fischerella sp. PCC 9605]|uniref:hypothetical protein n=1 Tax=Fischerella sp. PCC 9605 TaxID=1173024 RepID=UPI0004B307FF|nr:hypothetical protein [Fischerella sp. PCC 9605]
MEGISLVILTALITWLVEWSADAVLNWAIRQIQQKDNLNDDDEDKRDENQLNSSD